MKKLVAFLTLFIMSLGISNAEITKEELVLSHFKDRFEKLGLPSALKGEEYKRVLDEYESNKPNALWKNDEYEKLASLRWKYCKKGLYEACQRLGEQYMLGVGVERDLTLASELMAYNQLNSEYEYLKLRSSEMVDLGSEIYENKLNSEDALRVVRSMLVEFLEKCGEEKTDKPYCLAFFMLSDVVPNHLTKTSKGILAVDVAWELMLDDKFAPQLASAIKYYNTVLSYKSSSANENLPNQSSSKKSGEFSRDDSKGIVIDSTYKLMWEDGTNIFNGTWDETKRHCQNLNFAGFSDWRLPTRFELLSITDDSRYNPATYKVFKNTKPTPYWTSTKSANNSREAFFVNFDLGTGNWFDVSAPTSVRCVRDY